MLKPLLKDRSFVEVQHLDRWQIYAGAEFDPTDLCCSHGHSLLAFRLSRASTSLSASKTVELGHHILKAHIYRAVSKQQGFSSRDMQAFWLCTCADGLSPALVSQHNVFLPNVKVSRLHH